MRKTTMGRVRKTNKAGRSLGFIVTWDLDSRDKSATMRLYHFIFGREVVSDRRIYRYAGFVHRPGVRYLGQSVLFVTPASLQEIRAFLGGAGIDHEVIPASLG